LQTVKKAQKSNKAIYEFQTAQNQKKIAELDGKLKSEFARLDDRIKEID